MVLTSSGHRGAHLPETIVSEPPKRRPMTREDICNIEPVSNEDFLIGLLAMQAMDLIDDAEIDQRWTLAEGGA